MEFRISLIVFGKCSRIISKVWEMGGFLWGLWVLDEVKRFRNFAWYFIS